MQFIVMAVIYVACLIWASITGSLATLLIFSIPLFTGLIWIVGMVLQNIIASALLKRQRKGRVMANSKHYNDVPETRGTARNKGTFIEPTGRDLEDALRLAAFKATVEKEGEDNVATDR